MAEQRELVATLEKLLEKLYTGYKLYGAIIYLSYGVAINLFLLIAMTPWYRGLSSGGQAVTSIAYWVIAAILVIYATNRYARSYLAQLEARLGERTTRRKCNKFSLVAWASFPLVMYGAWVLADLAGRGGSYAASFSVLVALGAGNLGNALMEKCYGEGAANPPMISALLLLAGSPLALLAGWGYAAVLIMLAYTATALAYVYQALKKLA